MREIMHLTAVAFSFLTRLPVPHAPVEGDDLRRASGFYGLVGLAVAAIGLAVRALTEPLWGPLVATMLAVLSMVAVTGALHEDGLADTADGLWGGSRPAERIAIMRDSRLGTYGTVALVATLGLRVSLLAPLALEPFAAALIAGHVLGRSAPLVVARLLPAAVPGSGAAIAGRLGPGLGATAALTALLSVVATAGWWAPLVLAVAFTVTLASVALFRRRLGGVTGDALGAVNVLVEVATIATVAAASAVGP